MTDTLELTNDAGERVIVRPDSAGYLYIPPGTWTVAETVELSPGVKFRPDSDRRPLPAAQ